MTPAARRTREAEREHAHADTNLFVGLLAGPAHPLHEDALAIFRRVAEGTLRLIVTSIVVAELVYVTRSLFGWDRPLAAENLGSLLASEGLVLTDSHVTRRALQLYGERPRLDFADAYLAAAALEVGPATIASFDTDLDGVPGLRRIEA